MSKVFDAGSNYQAVKAVNGGSALAAGAYATSGNVCGFPIVSVLAAAVYTLIIRANSCKVVKASGETWAAGDRVYYDESEGELTKTATGNIWVGHAAEAAGSSAVEGWIDFDGTLKSIQDMIAGLSFTDLADTPDALVADKYLVVDSEGDALELTDINFTDLADTPEALTASQYVKGNTAGDALEFSAT